MVRSGFFGTTFMMGGVGGGGLRMGGEIMRTWVIRGEGACPVETQSQGTVTVLQPSRAKDTTTIPVITIHVLVRTMLIVVIPDVALAGVVFVPH